MCAQVNIFDSQRNVKQYTIQNLKGTLVVKLLDYGSIITNILFTDKTGRQLDLVLGYDTFDGYLRKDNPYFGALVGRVGNRIANGQFTLNGTKYQLDINDSAGHNTLHGGLVGFDKKMWTFKTSTPDSITLEVISSDGDQHFPGSVRAGITYTVTEDNELRLEYTAQLLPDSPKDTTIINLTNHSYFNLNGCTDPSAISTLNHELRMNADQFLEVNKELIPDEKVILTRALPVMDFTGTTLKKLSDRIPNLIDGYDHCYVVNGSKIQSTICGNQTMNEAVVIRSPMTGITMSFSTTEPAFQFYTGNGLNNTFTTKTTQSKQPLKLDKHSAFCLEGQKYIDAINHTKWQNQVILHLKDTYKQTTAYKFTNQ